jgi:HlyD family secretion protein
MVWLRRAALILVVALILGGVIYTLLPQPVAVDAAVIDRGSIDVTVAEEGMARVRNVYEVFAPVAGNLDRFPLEVGDPVERSVTVVAEIRPSEPAFLDVRSQREVEAAVAAAAAAVRLAEAELSRAEAERRLADADLERARQLAGSGTISERALDQAVIAAESARAQVNQAEASLELRSNELVSAQARLMQPGVNSPASAAQTCCVLVRAPADGEVLRVHVESAQVVQAGVRIAEIGDPSDMEVVVDLLSSDAVRVIPGAAARIGEWGGDAELSARVRRIEPSAFTKVSALGIEEQRVNVVLDVLDPRDAWERLGHEFRVQAVISLWRGENLIRVPLAALFRRGSEWAVFRIVDGKAALTTVTINHRNEGYAEVVSGLSEGDMVVLHPSDQVEDGVGVELREET